MRDSSLSLYVADPTDGEIAADSGAAGELRHGGLGGVALVAGREMVVVLSVVWGGAVFPGGATRSWRLSADARSDRRNGARRLAARRACTVRCCDWQAQWSGRAVPAGRCSRSAACLRRSARVEYGRTWQVPIGGGSVSVADAAGASGTGGCFRMIARWCAGVTRNTARDGAKDLWLAREAARVQIGLVHRS